MKRLFAAIKITPDEALSSLYYKLKIDLKTEKIKWVDLQNLHITLKFFGETDEDRIPEVSSHLNQVASEYSSFDLRLSGLGIFGSAYKPRVIWAGIEENNTLKELGLSVLNEMDKIGYKLDRQNFVPHLTLARIKFIDNKARLSGIIHTHMNTYINSETITSFHLYESVLHKTGPEYFKLESFNLGPKS